MSAPSNRINPTASDTTIGKNSPSVFGLIAPIPTGPSVNPPIKRRTMVGRCSLRDKTVRKQPDPRAKHKAQSPWLFCTLVTAIWNIDVTLFNETLN